MSDPASDAIGNRREMERAGLDPETDTVHDVVSRVSGAQAVFRRFGLDTCCGGDVPLARAAEIHGVDLDQLLDALERRDGSA